MKNSKNPWTPEEVDRLRTLLEANSSIHLIAAKLKRTVSARDLAFLGMCTGVVIRP
jgi:hypothetical protein